MLLVKWESWPRFFSLVQVAEAGIAQCGKRSRKWVWNHVFACFLSSYFFYCPPPFPPNLCVMVILCLRLRYWNFWMVIKQLGINKIKAILSDIINKSHDVLACPYLRLSFALELLLCYLNEFCQFVHLHVLYLFIWIKGTASFLDVTLC